ncbi:MAG: hypothetical protein ACO1RX_06705 [Candidatus Sericytochromatia bacterium]
MPIYPRHSSVWLLSLLSLTLGACQASSTGTPTPTTPSASVQPSSAPTPTPEPSSPAEASPVPGQPSASPVPLPTPSGAGSSATINLPDGSRLVLTLPNRFLTDSGQSITVSAQLLDANGQPLPLNSLQLLYSSSRPQDFSISDQGVITSLVNDGYSTITVRINGTDLSASQLISVSALSSGGGGGGGGSTPRPTPTPQENVNAEIGFEGLRLGEFLVGDSYDSDEAPAVAVAPDGRFVVAWTGDDDNDSGIYAQRYNSMGIAQGPSFLVNQAHTEDDQEQPAIAINSAGDFVITWRDEEDNAIYARVYNSLGEPLDQEFRANTNTNDDHSQPDVALNDNGHFVLTWQNDDNDNIYARRYGSGYTADASEFQVTLWTGAQEDAQVAMDAEGDFTVVWHTVDGNNHVIQARQYTSNGSVPGGEFMVDTTNFSVVKDNPDVAMNAAGQFVITWESEDSNGSGIYARRYNSAATALDGSEFQVNTTTTVNQTLPRIAIDGDGDFMVAWLDDSQYGVFAQRFTSAATPLKGEFKVSVSNDSSGSAPAIGLQANGTSVLAWTSSDSVYAKRYNSNGQVQ